MVTPQVIGAMGVSTSRQFLGLAFRNLNQITRAIFKASDNGFVYDPLDMSTMYQDAAGTSPVSLTAQPLGLILDKSNGLTLGAELFNDSAVQLSGATKVSTGVYRINTPDATFVGFSIPITGLRYKWVYLDFDVVRQGSGTARIDHGVGLWYVIPSVVGRYTVRVYCDRPDNSLVFIRGASPTDIDIKINSIKFLAGNHACQTTSAARPLFKQVPILGNELVVNGDFSNSTAGVAAKNNVTLSVTDGVLKVTNNDVYFGFAEMSFNTEVGKKYLLRADVIASSSSGASFHVASITNSNDILNNVAAETMAKGVVITAKTTSTYISLKVPTNVVGSWRTFDNVSAKELQGYYTDKNYVEYDGVDDKLLTTFAAPLTNCTVIRAVPNEGTKILYNQTFPASYEDTLNHSGFFAINRALSNSEKVLLLNVMDKRTGITSLDSQVVRSFANNEVGVAFNGFNDMSVLFQDAAGGIPVTAVGQPVGLILDKSRGLALGVEKASNNDFSNNGVDWTITGGVPTYAGGVVTLTTQAGGTGEIYQDISVPVGRWVKITARAKHSNALSFGINVYDGGGYNNYKGVIPFGPSFEEKSAYFFSTTGSLRVRMRLGTGSVVATGDVDYISVKELAGNHAYQTVSASRPVLRQSPILGNELVVNGDFSNGTTGWNITAGNFTVENGRARVVYTTNGGIFKDIPVIAGKTYEVSFKVENISGPSASLYVYDGAGFTSTLNFSSYKSVRVTPTSSTLRVYGYKSGAGEAYWDDISVKEVQGYYTDRNYLEFDGVDDFLQTNNIDFTSTDKVSVFAGVRKLSDASAGKVVELSNSVGNVGTFSLNAPDSNGAANFAFAANGTALSDVKVSGFASPTSAVLTAFGNNAASTIQLKNRLRMNGVYTAATYGGSIGAGNYGNYPLFIGRRGGTSLPFNGHLYSLIIMGRLASDTETTVLENAIAKQVGVTINV